VVAVARKGETPPSRFAKYSGISESCLHCWLKPTDIDDGVRSGMTSGESTELLSAGLKSISGKSTGGRPAATVAA